MENSQPQNNLPIIFKENTDAQKNVHHGSFGKTLLIIELSACILVSLICLGLAAWCIQTKFSGSLPWLSGIVSVCWAAYGTSKATYNKKTAVESLPYCEAEAQQIMSRDA